MIHYTKPSQQPGWGKPWTRHPGRPAPPDPESGYLACGLGTCRKAFPMRGRKRYCTETCRYTAMMQRRAKRKAQKNGHSQSHWLVTNPAG